MKALLTIPPQQARILLWLTPTTRRFHSQRIRSTKVVTGWEEATPERVSGQGEAYGEEGDCGATCKPHPASLTASTSLLNTAIRLQFLQAYGNRIRWSRVRSGSKRRQWGIAAMKSN